jgi:hypothetical protein
MKNLDEAPFWKVILITLFCRCRSEVDSETKQDDLVIMVVYYKFGKEKYKIAKYILDTKADIEYKPFDAKAAIAVVALATIFIVAGIWFYVTVIRNT